MKPTMKEKSTVGYLSFIIGAFVAIKKWVTIANEKEKLHNDR